MSDKEKKKPGRPKEIPGDKCDLAQVQRLAGLGLTDEEIGVALKVCEKTINNWKKDDEFLTALKRGKQVADTAVVKSLFKRAIGFTYTEKTYEGGRLTKKVLKTVSPDVTAGIYWTKNRRPDLWRDRRDLDVRNNTTVTLKSEGLSTFTDFLRENAVKGTGGEVSALDSDGSVLPN